MGGMRSFFRCLVFVFVLAACSFGQQTASSGHPAQTEVPALIREFLAHVGEPAMHERFWANDLMYTSAAGVFRTKAEILASMHGTSSGNQKDGATYSAEDMTVRDYGNVVVVAFRLVRHEGAKVENLRNTGTFLLRNGKWQAVGWQATRMAEAQK
jgi:Domain of unknown function (DUF4440)